MFVAHTGLATVMSDPYREEDTPAANPDAAMDYNAISSTSDETNESNARPLEDLRQHLELWRTPSDTLYDPSTVVSPLNANDVLETVQQKESELRLAAELGLSLLEKCQAQEAEITELETRLRGYQENERMYYDDKVFAVESELRRIESENGELKSQITVLEGKLTRTTRERDKQQKDLQAALTQIEHHVEDLEVAHDVQAELRKENHRLQARLASLQHEMVPPSLPSPMGASEPQAAPVHHSEQQQHQQDMALLLSFLSELQASNAKLKSELSNGENLRETNLRLNAELAEVRALLAEARNDLAFLQSENGSEPASSPDDLLVLSPRKSLVHELEEVIRKSPSQSSIDGAHKDRSQATAAGASGPYLNSIPKSTSDNGQQHPLSRAKSKSISLPNVSSCPAPLLTHFRKLTVLSDSLHNRLSQTDPQSLNRKFRRSFEIRELSKLSQSVIESVQMDVQEMGLRFPSRLSTSGDMRSSQSEMSHSRDTATNVDPIDIHKSRNATTATGLATTQDETRGNTTTDSSANESSLYYLLFLPLLHLIQRLLLDICKQRITNNDYVLAYYEKIIERSQTTETTRIGSSPTQKDAPSVAATVRTVKHTKSFGSLGSYVNTERVVGWFSPVRNRKPSSPNGVSVSASGEK
ncbi:hypothetical protein HDU85_004792 [Gaertneriomyces sp. JEL0708]|nr:hypothetical protein HDU85_004792 [Gaertneriomyces sp. JEL0708]